MPARSWRSAAAADLFASPQHPYTAALLAALPERSDGGRLATIPGVVPGLYDRPRGCLFSPRCAYATEHSRTVRPELRPWAGWPDPLPLSPRRSEPEAPKSKPIIRSARRLHRERSRRRSQEPEARLRGPPRVVQGTRAPAGGRRRLLHRRARQDPRGRRRIRLRQVHSRPHGDADREADRGRAQPRRHRCGQSARRRGDVACAARCSSSSRTPTARSIPRKKVGTILEEPLVINTKLAGAERTERARDDDGEGRPAAGALRPLSAHVLRRPAPAHRHRARADALVRSSWSRTSRSRPSTCRSRPRS